jgi:hypothetical protein
VSLDLGLAGLALWLVAIIRPEAGRAQVPSEGSVA